MKGLGNINKLMKQAQAMQEKMAQVQEELAAREIDAQAGGGSVTVRMNGKFEVMSLKVDPDMIDPDDADMLEDAVLAALREAHRKVTEMTAEEMSKVTGGMGGMPGLF